MHRVDDLLDGGPTASEVSAACRRPVLGIESLIDLRVHLQWAIEVEHEGTITREQLSGYYLASAVAADYGGMLIALPETDWTRRFGSLKPTQFAAHLRTCASHVRHGSVMSPSATKSPLSSVSRRL